MAVDAEVRIADSAYKGGKIERAGSPIKKDLGSLTPGHLNVKGTEGTRPWVILSI